MNSDDRLLVWQHLLTQALFAGQNAGIPSAFLSFFAATAKEAL